MSKTSIGNQIAALVSVQSQMEVFTPDEQKITERIRTFDGLLSIRFEGILEAYNEGRIAAYELPGMLQEVMFLEFEV